MKGAKHLQTIAELRKEAERDHREPQERLFSSIGLVVDCSNVFRYEKNRDFTQKLRIIDASSQDPLQVMLWSNQREDFSLNVKVGDVLYFNRFRIDLYNGNLQAKKAFKVEDSYFRIFSGNTDLTNYSPIDKKVGLDDEDGHILAAITDLRKYSKTYFKNNRVPVLFKQEGKEKKGEPKRVSSSDFDVILRVVESQEVASHFKVRLTNEKDDYVLNYTRSIEPGVYKLRSVADVRWEDKIGHLSGNDYTYFLEISSWMKSYDPKEWDRLIPDPKARKIQRVKIESSVSVPKTKKINKLTLKELIAKGISLDMQTTTKKMCVLQSKS